MQLMIETPDGQLVDRLCPWSRYVQRAENGTVYHTVFYHPPDDEIYKFQYPHAKKRDRLKIYEAHVGISSPEENVASYDNFRINVIPRIVRQGSLISVS